MRCEVEEQPSGVTDTLLQEPHITENRDNIISFAPREGNKPLGIFMVQIQNFCLSQQYSVENNGWITNNDTFLHHIAQ